MRKNVQFTAGFKDIITDEFTLAFCASESQVSFCLGTRNRTLAEAWVSRRRGLTKYELSLYEPRAQLAPRITRYGRI